MTKLVLALAAALLAFAAAPEASAQAWPARPVRVLVAGEVPVMFELFPSALGHVKSGRIRALAVTSAARSPLMQELPTVAEAGLPGYEIASWFGFVAPAGTPHEAVIRLNGEIVKLIATPEMHARLATLGAEPRPSTPEQFSQLIPAEIRKWARVIRESGAKVE